jgi:hypothetical protein
VLAGADETQKDSAASLREGQVVGGDYRIG